MPERPFLQIIAEVDRSQPETVGVQNLIAIVALVDPPRRRKTAFLLG